MAPYYSALFEEIIVLMAFMNLHKRHTQSFPLLPIFFSLLKSTHRRITREDWAWGRKMRKGNVLHVPHDLCPPHLHRRVISGHLLDVPHCSSVFDKLWVVIINITVRKHIMKDLMGHPRYHTINLSEILLPRQPEPVLKLRLLYHEIRAIHSKQHWAIPYTERPQPKCFVGFFF